MLIYEIGIQPEADDSFVIHAFRRGDGRQTEDFSQMALSFSSMLH